MGLDVYLRSCPNRAAADAAEAAANVEVEAHWSAKFRDEMSNDERHALLTECDEIAAKHGVKNYRHESVTTYENASAKYPGHMFQVGYFRSSYNGSGTNSVLSDRGLPDLYDIFSPPDDYEFVPDWAAARVRAADAVEKCRAFLASPEAAFDVYTLPAAPKSVASANDALKMVADADDRDHSYSNAHGTFFNPAEKVRAVISGEPRFDFPVVYVVTEKEHTPPADDWYLQALEIVLETIDFVLAQPNPEQFYLTWSA